MKIGSFEFNLRELAGSFGDFGTLFPLAIGYIAVCGLDSAGLLVMMGLANIVTGLLYRLSMPIEPMKVLAVMAIAQRWTPSMVYASAVAMGAIWPAWPLGIIALGIILLLRENRYAPASVVLILLGIVLMAFRGELRAVQGVSLRLLSLTVFGLRELWRTLLLAGFAQAPLTATNAVITTSVLIRKYWPDRPVSENRLALNMGVMNLVLPFFGGMPLCHGHHRGDDAAGGGGHDEVRPGRTLEPRPASAGAHRGDFGCHQHGLRFRCRNGCALSGAAHRSPPE